MPVSSFSIDDQDGLPKRMHASTVVRWLRLLACIAVVLMIWLVALPAASRLDSITQRMSLFEELGIDPSARYYTDQPAGWRNARHMQAILRQSPEAFWIIDSPPIPPSDVPESSN